MTTVTLHLPWPPTTNHLYATVAGKRVLTKAGRAYKRLVAQEVMVARASEAFPTPVWASLTITAYFPDHRRRDLSNLVKLVEDGLTEGAVWSDDRQVGEIHLYKLVPGPHNTRAVGMIDVELTAIPTRTWEKKGANLDGDLCNGHQHGGALLCHRVGVRQSRLPHDTGTRGAPRGVCRGATPPLPQEPI